MTTPTLHAARHVSAKEIVETTLRDYGPVERIILFGSAARGEADAQSDIDLIIVKHTAEPFVKRLVKAPYFSVPTDIFVYTPEEFEAMRKNENPFVMNALEQGITIYP